MPANRSGVNEPTQSENAGDVPRPAVVEQSNVVSYVFPVEVEIVGNAVADEIFVALRRAFEALG
jgi:hypothetical protein